MANIAVLYPQQSYLILFWISYANNKHLNIFSAFVTIQKWEKAPLFFGKFSKHVGILFFSRSWKQQA